MNRDQRLKLIKQAVFADGVKKTEQARIRRLLTMITLCSGPDGGSSHPRIDTLAERLDVNRRTIQRWCRLAEELGVLVIDPRFGGSGGGNKSNEYGISWRRLLASAERPIGFDSTSQASRLRVAQAGDGDGVERGDNLSPRGRQRVTPGRQSVTPRGRQSVTPQGRQNVTPLVTSNNSISAPGSDDPAAADAAGPPAGDPGGDPGGGDLAEFDALPREAQLQWVADSLPFAFRSFKSGVAVDQIRKLIARKLREQKSRQAGIDAAATG